MLAFLDLRGVPRSELASKLPRPQPMGELPVEAVRGIISEVRHGGDEALLQLAQRFEGRAPLQLRVPEAELEAARKRIPARLGQALQAAAEEITRYHRHSIVSAPLYREGGVEVRELRRPVRRAGCYVPGGRARYPSSVLMTAIPASVAGVAEVAVCTPPGPDGRVDDATLAAASIAGVTDLYALGGAQAIAAMAYGTETVRPVDVIAGPGNVYVSVAQREVAGVVGVPSSFAGPSEVVVVADETTDVRHAALDVVVQAEHGPAGLAWLITWSAQAAAAISEEVGRIVASSPRSEEIRSTLASGGYAVVVDGPAEAIAVSNAVAPEHLELMCAEPESLLDLVQDAGVVFVGPWAPAAIGDYMAGPSHVLPTFGSARFASVLGVDDFTRKLHAVSVSREGLARLAPHAAEIALAEGLDTHAKAVSERVGGGKQGR